MVVLPRGPERAHDPFVPRLQACRDRYLHRLGSILFRGFRVAEDAQFRNFVSALSGAATTLDFDIPPARRIIRRWPGSIQLPASEDVLHNVRAYSRYRPSALWFWCMVAPFNVALVDCRDVYAEIPAPIRQRWSDRGLTYMRSFEATGALSWALVFGTSSHAEVERRSEQQGFDCEWGPQGALRIWRSCSPTQLDTAGIPVWLNQAHVFAGASGGPWRVQHADGSPIAPADVQAVLQAFDACKTLLPCEVGDVLVIDNMLTAHACLSPVPNTLGVAREYRTEQES
jgi:hypothetical protein